MKRYVVQKCDNGTSLDSGKQITWAVVDRTTGNIVEDCDTRIEARRRAKERNFEAEASCGCL